MICAWCGDPIPAHDRHALIACLTALMGVLLGSDEYDYCEDVHGPTHERLLGVIHNEGRTL